MTFACRKKPSILTIAMRIIIAVAGIVKKRNMNIMNIAAVGMNITGTAVAKRAMCTR